MDPNHRADDDLDALAARLHDRREHILTMWRDRADSDTELTTGSTLSRAQFHDHIPEVLEAFERRLSARQRAERAEAAADQKEGAAEHGLQRWQQGYKQREVMREWRHLQLCLVEELEQYLAENPAVMPDAMVIARRALADLCSEGVCESAAQYARYQQAEAAGRVRDLEQAFVQLTGLEQERAEAWRAAVHDLRGRLGAVTNATELLHDDEVPEPNRTQVLALLQRSVSSLHALLNDLISLTRLEAGHEQRLVETFDVANMLRGFCETLRPIAIERGLFLDFEGPKELVVQGDAVKTQRIAQNLLLNALRYTARGGVKVTWAEAGPEGSERWALCVQDTGPGLQAGSVAPLARALKRATEEAGVPSAQAEPAPTSQSQRRPAGLPSGEGIGLSIVKRLCDLLDASLELETEEGRGSTFRVIFPRRYDG